MTNEAKSWITRTFVLLTILLASTPAHAGSNTAVIDQRLQWGCERIEKFTGKDREVMDRICAERGKGRYVVEGRG